MSTRLPGLAWGAPRNAGLPAIDIRPRPAPVQRSHSPALSDDISVTANVGIRPTTHRATTSDQLNVVSTTTLDSFRTRSEAEGGPDTATFSNSSDAPQAVSGGRQKKVHQCSTCRQVFARAEHLIRHERSHRKERPFSCVICDATFTRKDLVKRHMTRHHSGVTGPSTRGQTLDNAVRFHDPTQTEAMNMTTSPAETTSSHRSARSQHNFDLSSSSANHMNLESPMEMMDFETLLADVNSQTLDMQMPANFTGLERIGSHSAQDSFLVHPAQSGHSHGLQPIKPPTMVQNPVAMPPTISVSNPQVQAFPSNPSDAPLKRQSFSDWQGSFAISEMKRAEIMHDVEQVYSLAQVDPDFKIPSCIAFERYITAFFDAFLVHVPCIHVPTWRAEDSHPSLLLAMAALGANYHEEKATATNLHRSARLSIINHLEITSFTSKNRPTWVMQSLFLIMTYGVWSGEFDAVQESLAFQANLAHIVRYVCPPSTRWVEDRNEPGISWIDWIEIETLRRTKFAIYCLFNDLTITYNVPPGLINSEVDMNLPCTEVEWTASTPQLWHQCRSYQVGSQCFLTSLHTLLSPHEAQSLTCTTFGAYIMLSALLQQMYHVREASLSLEPASNARLQSALHKWQAMTDIRDDSLVLLKQLQSPMAVSSLEMLRLAYIRLCTDFSKVKTVVSSQHVVGISNAMYTHLGHIERSKTATNAALYAIHALRSMVKLGMKMVARTGSLVWSLQVHLYSFESCLFLGKWLETMEAADPTESWTDDERKVLNLVTETLAEVDFTPAQSNRPSSARAMYAWAMIYDCFEIWGVVPILGASIRTYADRL